MTAKQRCVPREEVDVLSVSVQYLVFSFSGGRCTHVNPVQKILSEHEFKKFRETFNEAEKPFMLVYEKTLRFDEGSVEVEMISLASLKGHQVEDKCVH